MSAKRHCGSPKNNKILYFRIPSGKCKASQLRYFRRVWIGTTLHCEAMTVGDTDYSDELSIADPETLGTLLRKIDDDPKILATWNLYLEKDQPFTIASNVEKWEEIKDWLRENQRSKHW